MEDKDKIGLLIKDYVVNPEEFAKHVLISSSTELTIDEKLNIYIEARDKAREYNRHFEELIQEATPGVVKQLEEKCNERDEEEKHSKKSIFEQIKQYVRNLLKGK